VIIPQAGVESLLEEHAKELGAEIRRGHELIALHQNEQEVGSQVRTASGDYELPARFLVGCDGGHSTVRKQLGVAFPGIEPTVVGRLGDVRLDAERLELLKQVPDLGGREFGIARTNTGNFAIVPLGGGIYRVAAIEWEQPSFDHAASMTLEELQAAIRRVTGIDLPMRDLVWLSRATDSSRLVNRYRLGRVLLAGDGAHVQHRCRPTREPFFCTFPTSIPVRSRCI
jgi:2-polyprenyl-6-methoxyphenol hydroxylase-like FAD-dependent oxidoreductase